MNTPNTPRLLLLVAMTGLLAVLLLCVAGILYLSAQQPARAVPDILVGTTTLIVGTIAGLLVNPRERD